MGNSTNGTVDVDLIPKPKKKGEETLRASLMGPASLWEWYDAQVATFNAALKPDEEEWSRNSLMIYALQRYRAELEEERAAKKGGRK